MNFFVTSCSSCGVKLARSATAQQRCEYCKQPVGQAPRLAEESLSSLGIKDLQKRRDRLVNEIERLVQIRSTSVRGSEFTVKSLFNRVTVFAAIVFLIGILFQFTPLIILGLLVAFVVTILNLYKCSVTSGRFSRAETKSPPTEVDLLRKRLAAVDQEIVRQR